MYVGRESSDSQAWSQADVAILALELICIGLWVSIIFGYILLRCIHITHPQICRKVFGHEKFMRRKVMT